MVLTVVVTGFLLAAAQCAMLVYVGHVARVLSERCTQLEADVEGLSAAHVAGELAELKADVDHLSRTFRKNIGRVWAEMHHDGALRRNNESQGPLDLTPRSSGPPPDVVDDDLEAVLALQSAKPARPS